MAPRWMFPVQDPGRRQYSMIGNKNVVRDQRIGASAAHARDKPGVLDFKLRDRCKPHHLADDVVLIIFDLNPEPAPRGMPAAGSKWELPRYAQAAISTPGDHGGGTCSADARVGGVRKDFLLPAIRQQARPPVDPGDYHGHPASRRTALGDFGERFQN